MAVLMQIAAQVVPRLRTGLVMEGENFSCQHWSRENILEVNIFTLDSTRCQPWRSMLGRPWAIAQLMISVLRCGGQKRSTKTLDFSWTYLVRASSQPWATDLGDIATALNNAMQIWSGNKPLSDLRSTFNGFPTTPFRMNYFFTLILWLLIDLYVFHQWLIYRGITTPEGANQCRKCGRNCWRWDWCPHDCLKFKTDGAIINGHCNSITQRAVCGRK